MGKLVQSPRRDFEGQVRNCGKLKGFKTQRVSVMHTMSGTIGKFRFWQFTKYGMLISVDADWLNLRNIHFPFGMPEITATGNNGALLNYGMMVLEPSNCTFQLLMDHTNDIEPYNDARWWPGILEWNIYMVTLSAKTHDLFETFLVKWLRRWEPWNLFLGADPPIFYVLH